MAAPRILPLGFIDRTTNNGAIMLLTTPSETHNLRLETAVTLTNRSNGETPATVRVRGIITVEGYVTATFKTEETKGHPTGPRMSRCYSAEFVYTKHCPADPLPTPPEPSAGNRRKVSTGSQPGTEKQPTPSCRPPSRHANLPGTADTQTHSRSAPQRILDE